MNIIRLAPVAALSLAVAWPASAQVPRPPAVPRAPLPPIAAAPPAAPARPAPPAAVVPWDVLDHIDLPDLTDLHIPPLPPVQLPPMPMLDLPAMPVMDLHAWQVPAPAPAPARPDMTVIRAGVEKARQDQYDGLYDSGRALIDQNQYDRAITAFDRIITAGAPQTPGAMYWKAYSLGRTSRRPDALTTLGALQKQFPKSPWVRDAQALEVELRQQSGQSVNADAQSDDELKLLALRALMQTDPEAALPTVEKMLGGTSSVRVKDRALFLVSQSRSARGRTVILGVAKGNNNPDLQLRAIRYIGQMGGTEAAQTLDEVYRSTGEERVKREIIRALGNVNARERLLALAKNESSADLRGEAVRALGNMNAINELEQLYRSETSVDVKRRILQGMQNGNAADKLAGIARSESDLDLRRSAIRYIANVRGAAAVETLTSLYNAESSTEIKTTIIDALGSNNGGGAALVSLARAEKNPQLKEHIVRRLGNVRSPEARDYLLEVLSK